MVLLLSISELNIPKNQSIPQNKKKKKTKTKKNTIHPKHTESLVYEVLRHMHSENLKKSKQF